MKGQAHCLSLPCDESAERINWLSPVLTKTTPFAFLLIVILVNGLGLVAGLRSLADRYSGVLWL